MRAYNGEEGETAKRLRERALSGDRDPHQRHEYLGGIDAKTWRLISFRTNGRPDGVDLGEKIEAHIKEGGNVIIHHNHIGFHSLSGGDWAGLVENPALLESWVHCWDGTRYWGKLIPGHEQDVSKFCKIIPKGSPHKNKVDALTERLTLNQKYADRKFERFVQEIGPHLVNKEMQKNGWVEYEADFGSYMGPLAEEASSK